MKFFILLLCCLPFTAIAQSEYVDIDTLESYSALVSDEYAGYNHQFEIYSTDTLDTDTLYLEQKIATKDSTNAYVYDWVPAPTSDPVTTNGVIVIDSVAYIRIIPDKIDRKVTYRLRRGSTRIMTVPQWIRWSYFPRIF